MGPNERPWIAPFRGADLSFFTLQRPVLKAALNLPASSACANKSFKSGLYLERVELYFLLQAGTTALLNALILSFQVNPEIPFKTT